MQCVFVVLLFVIALAPVSCAPTGGQSSGGGGAGLDKSSAGFRDSLASGDNGLRVRRWRVADRTEVIEAALLRYSNGDAVEEEIQARLERNGFRLVRIALEDIENLLAVLGGAMLDMDGWHGQAYDWRDVATRLIDPEGMAMAVDGRVRRFSDGELRLMVRGWTLRMEDGPYFYLEMLPELDMSRPNRLEQALGRDVFEGERFTAVSFDLLLESSYAYVLTCETPGVEWGADNGEGSPDGESWGEESAVGGDDEPAEAEVAVVGPDAEPPWSIGEVLLRFEFEAPGREMLVFVPRIPAELYPGRSSMSPSGVSEGELP